jgi:hypothetical protein
VTGFSVGAGSCAAMASSSLWLQGMGRLLYVVVRAAVLILAERDRQELMDVVSHAD